MNYVYELYYELYLFIFGNISAETFKKFNQTMGAHLIYQQPTDYWRDPTKEKVNTSPGLLLK